MKGRKSKRASSVSREKTEIFQFRLGPNEKLAFRQAAEISGLALSAWIRERLRKAAVRDLEEANKAIPFLQSRI